ncbi:MAG: T9SS type A sorting domain-containing protein [Ignavibacteriaceae bacterium]|nr:T9SS type A sorting domain-containing protein [Ignavibacteriaceae bacterium]
MTTDCAGGAVGVGYMNSDFAIRALKVSLNGNLGEVISDLENSSEELTSVETILYQNYPNPFNSSAIIKYQIPKVETHRDASPQLVKLIVYDVLGNEVATLVNEEKLPGVYEVDFNASSLASGMYLYKIQAGQNFIQTKKMILLK